jgi:hypothetical protein
LTSIKDPQLKILPGGSLSYYIVLMLAGRDLLREILQG